MACHVQVRGLSLSYRWKQFEKTIFKNLNLCIETGSFVSVIGSNGSGKSSLVKLVLGLIQAREGEILINGRAVKPGFPEAVKNEKIAYLAQQIEDLFYGETVREELSYKQSIMRPENQKHLTDLGLEALLDRSVESLSGGERQVLALADFMMSPAELLLLDEPSSYLDERHAEVLLKYLQHAQGQGKTILHVTQYPPEVAWGDHVIDLDQKSPAVVRL